MASAATGTLFLGDGWNFSLIDRPGRFFGVSQGR